jgi:uncharacterized protein
MTTPADAPALIDTNVLVYASDTSAPQHLAARAVRDGGATGTLSVCLVPQVLFEYVSVVTSSKRVAKPRPSEAAWAEVEKLASVFPVLPAPEDLFERVRVLVPKVKPKGAEVFDLAIAVTVLAAGSSVIYTFDAGVFARVPGVVVRAP